MNRAMLPVISIRAPLFVAFMGSGGGCADLHSRCGGKRVQPVEKLLGGACEADGVRLAESWLFPDQPHLFSHLRTCVSIVAIYLCTVLSPLSPVYVEPPVRLLWKTSPTSCPAGLPQGCSRNDQLGRQGTDPTLLFPRRRGCVKLSTMPVGRISQKVWTTCTHIAAAHAGRATDCSVRFLIKWRKSRRHWPAADFPLGFPHWLCNVVPGTCGPVVDESLQAALSRACVGVVNICPGVRGALPILQTPWGREIQHVQLLGGTDPHRGPGRPR